MVRKIKKYYNDHHGFTMMELLIVVAILLILAAISMPNIISAQKQLAMAKLDEYARQIYMAAQNETTKMKASGELGKLSTALKDQHPDWKLPQKPQDYPDDAASDWDSLYYIASSDQDDDLVNTYFLQASSALAEATENGGSFIIEFNPETGDVYSVFYSETPAISYSSVTGLASRNRKDRQSQSLGYYCGDPGNILSGKTPDNFNPKVTFRNEEELWVDITCSGMSTYIGGRQRLHLKLTFTDEHGKKAETTYDGGSFEFETSGTDVDMKISVLLDSLAPKSDFATLTKGFKGDALTPGDDIKAEAELSYNSGSVNVWGRGENTDNSLFASRETMTEGTGTITEIKVANLRHLNNLRGSRYSHPGGSPETTVLQTQPIDFKDPQQKYLTGFEAIKNDSLFERSIKTTYDGGGLALSNFDFTPYPTSFLSYTGLFAELENSILENIRLENCKATGEYNTGILAGSVESSSLKNCSVYLTKQEDGSYPVADRKATGESAVGGLAGACKNSAVENCFAAVDVSGGSNIGGLIGSMVQGTVSNSYSSGTVNANSAAGGLIGIAVGPSEISDCYSTSNVFCDAYAGGFVGNSMMNSAYEDDISYGQVLNRKGTGIGAQNSGGFVGNGTTKFTSCSYLSQANYNDSFSSPAGITAESYASLRASAADAPAAKSRSFPYDKELFDMAFPFPLIKTGTNVLLPHYGNWPLEVKLPTCLIYYERYTDGAYGYYGEFSLPDSTKTGGGEAAADLWKIDTLRYADAGADRNASVCAEDGYALLTPYTLETYDYRLNEDITDNTMPKINQNKQAIRAADVIGKDLTLAPVLKDPGSSTAAPPKIEHYNIYRLPFELQMIDRESASHFYNQLKITGYVTKAAADSNSPVFKDSIFYYCPDFAKTAVNPPSYDPDKKWPADPDGSPENEEPGYVYVRSARQLNALGRNSYYWNDTYNSTTDPAQKKRKLSFRQEVDIDFGTYGSGAGTTGTGKQYCGQPFDLINQSSENKYRNRPIGKAGDGTKSRNFQYTYDGGGHRIIDYCCEIYPGDDNQFAGLFGEVRYAVIKNIILYASDPEKESGYVKSGYNGSNTAGVGALVGLSWMADGDTPSSVDNCAVSGYKVSYETTNAENSAAVGGLAGFNFGSVQNSTAVNRSVEMHIKNAGSGHTFLLGGLSGSINGTGKISRCYSGGNLISSVEKADANTDIFCSGIAGYFSIGGAADDPSNMLITDCYSYNTWRKTAISSQSTNYPISPKILFDNKELYKERCYSLKDAADDGIFTGTDVDSGEVFTLGDGTLSSLNGFGKIDDTNNIYPWEESLESSLIDKDYPFKPIIQTVDKDYSLTNTYIHYGRWPTEKKVSFVYPCYYETYKDDSYGVYYWDDQGNLTRTLDKNNEREITQAGYGILCSSDKDFTFVYGETPVDDLSQTAPGINVLADTSIGTIADVSTGSSLNIYPFDEWFAEEHINIHNTPDIENIPDTYKALASRVFGISHDGSVTDSQRFYLNTNFAANLFPNADNTGDHYAEVRTLEQLQALSDDYDSAWTFNQTHHITVDDTFNSYDYPNGLISNGHMGSTSGGGYCYDGRTDTSVIDGVTKPDNEIRSLLCPLFNQNNGEIKNVKLVNPDVSAEAGYSAPLVLYNHNSISNCSVSGGSVYAAAGAAGLVYSNDQSGVIENCFVENCTITTESDGKSAGFIVTQSDYGQIRNCTVVNCGINANGSAASSAGFIVSSNDDNGQQMIENCLVSNVNVYSQGDASGFIGQLGNKSKVTNCSVRNDSKNHFITASDGAATGFVIENNLGIIDRCSVESVVTSENSYVAGFVGENAAGNIKNCHVGPPAGIETMDQPYIYNRSNNPAAGAAGFAYYSEGSIEGCYVYSYIDSPNNSAGFALSNKAYITNCYASVTVLSTQNATGFTASNEAWIINCYAIGSVSASVSSSGFFREGEGEGAIINCYSLIDVRPGNAAGNYGFGPTVSSVQNSYWVAAGGINQSPKVNEGSAEKLTSFSLLTDKLETLNNYFFQYRNAWELKTPDQTHPASASLKGKPYPYPALKELDPDPEIPRTLDHYGDWPYTQEAVPFITEEIGIYRPKYTYEGTNPRQYALGVGLNQTDQKPVDYKSDLTLTWSPENYCVFIKTNNLQTAKQWTIYYNYTPGNSDNLKTGEVKMDNTKSFDNTSYANMNNELYTKFILVPQQKTYKMVEVYMVPKRSGLPRGYHFTIDEKTGDPTYVGFEVPKLYQ